MQFGYRVYHRPFRRPLQTCHGRWSVREGILIQLNQHWGEIAPIPWLGSETLAAALAWCRSLPLHLEFHHIAEIPDGLPACQFAFESAWAKGGPQPESPLVSPAPDPGGRSPDLPGLTLPQSALLPTGEAALEAWRSLWREGYRTFKWKIGLRPIAEEQAWLAELLQQLPSDGQLRLDANGGLTVAEAEAWLAWCDRQPGIELLEQPLPPEEFVALCRLATQYITPIALDESVATVAHMQACYERGWPGWYVIKPAIAGFPSRLRQFWTEHPITAIFSSALETSVGRRAALQLAAEFPGKHRAVGFGVEQWLAEEEEGWIAKL